MASAAPGVSEQGFLAAGVTLILVTAFFVGARLVANCRNGRKLSVNDFIAVLALALTVVLVVLTRLMVDAMAHPEPTPGYFRYLIRLTQSSNWVSALAMWCSKAPILLLLITLFGVRVVLRISSYIVLVFLGIATLIAAAGTSAACDPRGGGITPEFILSCSQTASRYGFALGFVSVLVDVIIIVLPIPAVWQLNLPRHKKIGLSIVFMSGVFAIVASAIAVNYKWKSVEGTNTSLTNAMICTLCEICIAIMVGCAPAVYAFWQQVVVENSLYARLVSAFTAQHSASSLESRRRQQQGFDALSGGPPTSSAKRWDNQINQVSLENMNSDFMHPVKPSRSWNSGASAAPMRPRE